MTSVHPPEPEVADKKLVLVSLSASLPGSAAVMKSPFAGMASKLEHTRGEVSVTITMPPSAGMLKTAKLHDVRMQEAPETGTVTISGDAASVRAFLMDLFFESNPRFTQAVKIDVSIAHASSPTEAPQASNSQSVV
ncbi:MAG: hypothetical protein J0L97_03275, partial [Alphaproteobacteria bacterium]|nr:hypothetical protein [Alphaproteobacteria bacterium]